MQLQFGVIQATPLRRQSGSPGSAPSSETRPATATRSVVAGTVRGHAAGPRADCGQHAARPGVAAGSHAMGMDPACHPGAVQQHGHGGTNQGGGQGDQGDRRDGTGLRLVSPGRPGCPAPRSPTTRSWPRSRPTEPPGRLNRPGWPGPATPPRGAARRKRAMTWAAAPRRVCVVASTWSAGRSRDVTLITGRRSRNRRKERPARRSRHRLSDGPPRSWRSLRRAAASI